MSIISNTESESVAQPTLSGLMTLILAIGAGFSVASIYYVQPILPQIGHDLQLSLDGMGLVPTLTQIGYALGILLLLPLGDRYDRRKIIPVKSSALTAMLWLCSQVTGPTALWMSSLLLGMDATLAQDIVPVAAILAPAGKQGKNVGTVMTGLLIGILLSRTVSGVVGEYIGWRAMYQLAALSIAIIGIALWRILPAFAQHSALSYPGLLRSMLQLWRSYPALAQGLLSVGFSAFSPTGNAGTALPVGQRRRRHLRSSGRSRGTSRPALRQSVRPLWCSKSHTVRRGTFGHLFCRLVSVARAAAPRSVGIACAFSRWF